MRQGRNLIYCICFLLGWVPLMLQAQMTGNQQWYSVSLSQNVKDFRWTYEQNLRFRYGMYLLENSFSEFGGKYKLHKYLDIKTKYRVGFKDPHEGNISFYHRVNLDLNLNYNWKKHKLRLEYRPRIQVRFRPEEGRTDQKWVFRNKGTVTRKINKDWSAWIAGEAFIRLNKTGYSPFLDEVRGFAGVDWEFKKRQKIRLFYMYSQEVQQSDPWTNHIVGLGYSYRFKKLKFNKSKD